MANYNETGSTTQTVRRWPLSRRATALAAVGVILILALVIGGAVRSRRSAAPETSAPPAETAEAELPAPSPVPEEEAAPEEPLVRPTETSGELAVRTAVKRDGFPMLRWDIERFSPGSDGRMRYNDADKTLTGIDVSEHQGDINWKKVAADGIDFAMIRVGYRGSTAGGIYTDECFEANLSGANQAGVPAGVYFYSQAVTVEEALEEADFLLEAIRPYQVDFPVVFDWEIVGGSSARTYSVSRQTLRDCARAFCQRMKDEGYDPMIYFTQYLGYRKYMLRELSEFGFWYAEYGDAPRTVFDFDMWQYSETGEVAGIEGNVDLNIYFVR